MHKLVFKCTQEIEHTLITYIRQIHRKKKTDMSTFNRMEKELLRENAARRQNANTEEMNRKEQAKIKLAKERQTKKRFRVGKQPAWRSAKHQIKRVEVVKEISPDRLNFLKYLGQLDEEEEVDTTGGAAASSSGNQK